MATNGVSSGGGEVGATAQQKAKFLLINIHEMVGLCILGARAVVTPNLPKITFLVSRAVELPY